MLSFRLPQKRPLEPPASMSSRVSVTRRQRLPPRQLRPLGRIVVFLLFFLILLMSVVSPEPPPTPRPALAERCRGTGGRAGASSLCPSVDGRKATIQGERLPAPGPQVQVAAACQFPRGPGTTHPLLWPPPGPQSSAGHRQGIVLALDAGVPSGHGAILDSSGSL